MPDTLATLIKPLDHFPWTQAIPANAQPLVISEADRKAAWELYVELVTRVATQPLDDKEGIEGSALESISGLFDFTRELMRRVGPGAVAFSAFVLALLNHRVRPFTAKWHKVAVEGRLVDPSNAGRFRDELQALQDALRPAANVLAEMANVPPLSDFRVPKA